jgi:C1A family cysteine protease
VLLHAIKRYGTEPDRPDRRDHAYEVPPALLRRLPRQVDLRARCPPVYNQKHLNSCSANAIAAALWFDERRHDRAVPSPSRLFIYYNERAREGSVSINATVSLRDGYRSVARIGVCSERMWPYLVERYRRKPSPHCYEAAADHRAIWYRRLEKTLPQLKACLAEGYPFTGGFSVYQRFESRPVRRTGVVPMPGPHEKKLGGHAMLIVGYSDASEQFIVRNSWGSDWGDRGYGYLPYEYVLAPKHAWDFWTVRRVSRDR